MCLFKEFGSISASLGHKFRGNSVRWALQVVGRDVLWALYAVGVVFYGLSSYHFWGCWIKSFAFLLCVFTGLHPLFFFWTLTFSFYLASKELNYANKIVF